MDDVNLFEEEGKKCQICCTRKLYKYNLKQIKHDALKYSIEFSQRGLHQGAKWFSELAFALQDVELRDPPLTFKTNSIKKLEYDKYLLAFAYFRNQEYVRCVSYLDKTTSKVCTFLKYYATYMAIEMNRIMNITDTNMFSDPTDKIPYTKKMAQLANAFKTDYIDQSLDGYELYIYGLVLKRLRLNTDAKDILIESLHELPCNWNAWLELIPLITEKDELETLRLPNHWLKDFFWAQLFMDFHMSEKALEIYNIILHHNLHSFLYIHSQIAVCHHNLKAFWESYNLFKKIRACDCYRLDCMDIYSNLLYLGQDNSGKDTETRSELAILAHQAAETNKHRPETCCIIGNYYSARSEFVKAIHYYKRAVRINPYYATGWTLMGHEYMELKNTVAAILCYRKAISSNSRDFRAWFGLGQTYEIAGIPSFAILYYKAAHRVKPNDSRMLMALGDIYERLEKFEHSLTCYTLVTKLDAPDPLAASRIARTHNRMENTEAAVEVYTTEVVGKHAPIYCSTYKKEYVEACVFLCNYHLTNSNTEKAALNAQLLLKIPDRVDEYNRMMAEVAKKSEELNITDHEMKEVEAKKSEP